MHTAENNVRTSIDSLLVEIAEYASRPLIFSPLAYETARYCLMDAMGCALLALRFPACKKILGPVVTGADMVGGARVIGTNWFLDPLQAAFNIGSMIRWLDYNDTWLAAEWGHPSDNFGTILALGDYLSRNSLSSSPLTMQTLLDVAIKAYEIQGILALQNGFNRFGFDHVILVKIASTAVAVKLLGGTTKHIADALSQAWLDGCALRTYRHAPNTGSRKSWAAGDACSRAVRLALLTLRGEMGYASALTTPKWGFYDVMLKGQEIVLSQPLQAYVMENILFKIAYPAEFHAQTAVECAIQLHPLVKNRLSEIKTIAIKTQESAMRIISKTGALYNPADRDHCLQYMVAIGLLYGNLTAAHYEDDVASNPEIDSLRRKMQVNEEKRFSVDYLDLNKRSIANAMQIEFENGTKSDWVEIEYPLGHRVRRAEGLPLLFNKFIENTSLQLGRVRAEQLTELCLSEKLQTMPICGFVDLFNGEQ